eukprot:Rhum_TRINITY_DN25347_c0_g1::Rhum_TRINITY_DN25347_c0_g1_i1::g.181910::m.181910/K17065/DNM1L; dynamin 1-like protein
MSAGNMHQEGMERLLPVINQLQDVFAKVNMVHELDLPQIVVLGAQSTGKSSVLENIVGKDFLPRGSGIVTRRPLVLQMRHMSRDEHRRREECGEPTETASFLHQPDKLYTDFSEVRAEIDAETARKCGTTKGVSCEPIRLTVTSNHVLDLTLIDLPGLTKVAVQGQRDNVAAEIENMALEWIKPKNTIILAVTAANTDIANSDSLQLARRVDPNGDRTIGVLTKLDLMDRGTDCVDVLTGQVLKLKKGFIGLVNRSQHDIDNNKRIADALIAEKEYFQSHKAYSKFAKQLGTTHLTHALSHNLLLHIRQCLPSLRQNLQSLLKQSQALLQKYGDDNMNDGSRLLTLLQSYSKQVVQQLDGNVRQESATSEVTRGAKINQICTLGFVPYLEKMDPLAAINDEEVQSLISSCQGTRNRLFIPEDAFRSLVRICIQKLLQPSHRCVDYVHDEMAQLGKDAAAVLDRYPNLKEQALHFVDQTLQLYKEPLVKFVSDLVSMETSHINTNHPDFYDGGSMDQLIRSWADSTTRENGRENGDDDASEEAQIAAPSHAGLDHGNDFTAGVNYTAPMDNRRQRETEIIRELVRTYYHIVRRHMQDHVPKSIQHFMIDQVKEHLYTKLVEEFYKPDQIPHLLSESEEIAQLRKAAKNMEACLTEAVDTLNKIRDFRLNQ